MRETYRIGNAQSIGSYQIQSNYFAVKSGGTCLAVLADGTIDHINGRRGAVLAVEACMREFGNMPPQAELPDFFNAIAAKILQQMREIIYTGKTPYLSVSIQFLKDRELFYYSAGNNRLFLYNGTDCRHLKLRCGRAAFEKGMTAGMVSAGVWEALHEKELVSYLRRNIHPYEKAQRMIAGVKEKNRKMAGNATVILIEGCL